MSSGLIHHQKSARQQQQGYYAGGQPTQQQGPYGIPLQQQQAQQHQQQGVRYMPASFSAMGAGAIPTHPNQQQLRGQQPQGFQHPHQRGGNMQAQQQFGNAPPPAFAQQQQVGGMPMMMPPPPAAMMGSMYGMPGGYGQQQQPQMMTMMAPPPQQGGGPQQQIVLSTFAPHGQQMMATPTAFPTPVAAGGIAGSGMLHGGSVPHNGGAGAGARQRNPFAPNSLPANAGTTAGGSSNGNATKAAAPNTSAPPSSKSGFRSAHSTNPTDDPNAMNYQNLFITKIPRDVTDGSLFTIFRKYGATSAKVMVDAASGYSKGFGFVVFPTEEQGRWVHENFNKRPVSVTDEDLMMVPPADRPPRHTYEFTMFPSHHDSGSAAKESTSLYIRNVPKAWDAPKVVELLRLYGDPIYYAMRDDRLGQPVWVVYAEYDCLVCSRNALKHIHGLRTAVGQPPILAKFADNAEVRKFRRDKRMQAQHQQGEQNRHEGELTTVNGASKHGDNAVEAEDGSHNQQPPHHGRNAHDNKKDASSPNHRHDHTDADQHGSKPNDSPSGATDSFATANATPNMPTAVPPPAATAKREHPIPMSHFYSRDVAFDANGNPLPHILQEAANVRVEAAVATGAITLAPPTGIPQQVLVPQPANGLYTPASIMLQQQQQQQAPTYSTIVIVNSPSSQAGQQATMSPPTDGAAPCDGSAYGSANSMSNGAFDCSHSNASSHHSQPLSIPTTATMHGVPQQVLLQQQATMASGASSQGLQALASVGANAAFAQHPSFAMQAYDGTAYVSTQPMLAGAPMPASILAAIQSGAVGVMTAPTLIHSPADAVAAVHHSAAASSSHSGSSGSGHGGFGQGSLQMGTGSAGHLSSEIVIAAAPWAQ